MAVSPRMSCRAWCLHEPVHSKGAMPLGGTLSMSLQTLFSALLGVVQGLSEFLPISSSGHLMVAELLFAQIGYQADPEKTLPLMVMLHMGTLVAVAAVFWRDWVDMLRHPVKNKTLLYLFIASLPALFAKLLLGDMVDAFFKGWFLGICFLITAVFLVLVEALGSRGKHARGQEHVSARHAVVMGFFQALALPPGISRSGSTLLGGIASGLTRQAAAKFSFMMSAPAILGSFLSEGMDALDAGGLGSLFTGDILVGVLLSAISGFLAIRYMLRLIEGISFYKFALYVAAVGIIVIVMQLTGFADFPPIALPARAVW
jgi:undecaprenyl-diphosphatase